MRKKSLLFSVAAVALLYACAFFAEAWAGSRLDALLGGESKDYSNVRVEEVLSPDLIRLADGEEVRLIGVHVPGKARRKDAKVERDKFGFVIKPDVNPAVSVEDRALNFTRDLLEGKRVRLEFDVDGNDEQLHTLAYVFLVDDGTFVNAEILRQGFANLRIKPPNLKYADQLRQAYREAAQYQRGLQGRY